MGKLSLFLQKTRKNTATSPNPINTKLCAQGNRLSKFSKSIAPYVNEEILKATQAQDAGDYSSAFTYLENAHVLGQESTYWHVKVHYLMMLWGFKQHNIKEILGQVIRIMGAALLTAVKGVPVGNTGGSNVSPVKVMPIKPEHAAIISKAKENA